MGVALPSQWEKWGKTILSFFVRKGGNTSFSWGGPLFHLKTVTCVNIQVIWGD